MDRRWKGWIALSVIVALLALCLAVWALFFRTPETPAIPDIAPPVEDNIQPAGDDDGGKLPQTQGGGAVNLTYSDQVTFSLKNQTVSLYFLNPSRSNQSMVLQILIQDLVLVQTGTLPPGSQLNALPLTGTPSLAPGAYQGKFRVFFYDPQDGSQAQLNTEIPIQITVTE